MNEQILQFDDKRKRREREARRFVARRMVGYYCSLMGSPEEDAESVFERVVAIDAQRRSVSRLP